jgi:hypothetical protein
LVNLAVAGLVASMHLYFNAAFNLAAAFFIFGLWHTNRRLDREIALAREGLLAQERIQVNAELQALAAATGLDANERAKAYLARVCKLTGATQANDHGVELTIKGVPYLVKAEGAYRGKDRDGDWRSSTCLYRPKPRMPRDEQVANSVLQLYANPDLFGKWERCDMRYKPDGSVFGPR